MAKKSTVDRLNKPAKVVITFGSQRVKLKYDRLCELFNDVKEQTQIERAMIIAARKQLNY
jgi:methyl coenzyme M reductase subunit C-like uncharacterized protein (methanogenesis marker protein 7)